MLHLDKKIKVKIIQKKLLTAVALMERQGFMQCSFCKIKKIYLFIYYNSHPTPKT